MNNQSNSPEYSVSEISQALKRSVEEKFSHVRIRGEISGLKIAASGHVYFTLKDENAVLNGICWKGVAGKLPFRPEDGLEVRATGKISTYPGRSNYQIIVDWMEPAGAGALMALFEERKKKLAAEGLFAQEHKQELPLMSKIIGVVTSPTGAVIRDILHRVEDRFPSHVILWPVLVQGEGAAEQIANAINGFNNLANNERPDVLIVGRGGGSLEDLWAFNEEVVCRAIFASKIPLISAVGHETDTTLADYVADRRAPTPTAAAEIAVQVRDEYINWCYEAQSRLNGGVTREISQHESHLNALGSGLRSPRAILDNLMQRMDDWCERLNQALPKIVDSMGKEVKTISSRLTPANINQLIELKKGKLQAEGNLRPQVLAQNIKHNEDAVNSFGRLLESYNYKNVLKRGYALVWDEKGNLVPSLEKAEESESLTIEWNDGKKKIG